MTSKDLRDKYLKFFENKGHKIIPSASLVPENDASTLFVSSGMQPLVPYLLGVTHPEGTRLVNCQKCIRTGDIDEVGDAFHHTFFEMLGNWSLGDYFKQESIPWSFEFLTQELNISPDKLSVSVFAGDDDAPRDKEAAELWKSVGIPEDRIYYFGKEDNWWAAGPTGPCGPDTEIFYDVTGKPCGPDCRPGDNCGRYFEIWNNVFMVYNRKEDGTLEELPNKNVDTGMGLDRTITVLNGIDDNYKNDIFKPALDSLVALRKSGPTYEEDPKPYRIILDHLRAATFLVVDGVVPSNKDRGYILRRLIRRAMLYARTLGMEGDEWLSNVAPSLEAPYIETYPDVRHKTQETAYIITQEVDKFRKTINLGLKEFEKYITFGEVGKSETHKKMLSPKDIFRLYESFGFPYELSKEEANKRGIVIPDRFEFDIEMQAHQEKSRTSSSGMFKGGLAGDTPTTRKYHTAAHLLQASLRKILGDHVEQAGQNITDERLRFDFKHNQALTEDEKEKVEQMINEKIKEDLPVTSKIMAKEEAEKSGALALFKEKYGDQVSVYTVGNDDNFFSREFCGGPHVAHTGEIGHVTITKEESAGAGIRRIYIKLD